MPVQEALVWNKIQLARPAGVLFDPACASREDDEKAWRLLMPDMGKEISSGRFIMVLVQTRSTRLWNSSDDQYAFKPSEDYIIAAFSVSGDIGNPYEPGTIARAWLNRQLDAESGRTRRLTASCISMFQCSSKGCNLSTVGQLKLIKFQIGKGAPRTEAIAWAQNEISNGLKFGWRGGTFPGLWAAATVSAPVMGRGRSSAVLGTAPGPTSSSSTPDPFADF